MLLLPGSLAQSRQEVLGLEVGAGWGCVHTQCVLCACPRVGRSALPCSLHHSFPACSYPTGFLQEGGHSDLAPGLGMGLGQLGEASVPLAPNPFFPKPLLLAILAAGASLGGGGGEGVLASF